MDQPTAQYRDWHDVDTMRQSIFDGVQKAISSRYPLQNESHILEIADLGYGKPKNYSLDEQKKAIISQRNLDWPIYGTWRLKDKASGQVLSEVKNKVIARVPYLTPRGTFIFRGNEYVLSNQARLRPGIYARKKENGELESHVNLLPGTGRSFRLFMEPATGLFKFQLGQGQVPAYPILKALGASDSDMEQYWGPELAKVNAAKFREFNLEKVYPRFADSKILKQFSKPEEGVRAIFSKMAIDPEVSTYTLGKPYNKIDKEVLLRAAQKLLNIQKGEEDEDDRDSQSNQIFVTPEDLFAERISKDAGNLSRALMWKVSRAKDVSKIPSGYLTKQVYSTLLSTGLGSSITEVNPLEIADQLVRVSRLGQGAISSLDAVPDEARNVHPSQLGFVDIVKAPECWSGEDEVMTDSGWRPWKDVDEATRFACRIDGKLEFHRASRLFKSYYDGPMVHISCRGIRLFVTPNHRVWARLLGENTYRFYTAISLLKNREFFLDSGHRPYTAGDESIDGTEVSDVSGVNGTKVYAALDRRNVFQLRYEDREELLNKLCAGSSPTSSFGVSLRLSRLSRCKQVELLLFSLGRAVNFYVSPRRKTVCLSALPAERLLSPTSRLNPIYETTPFRGHVYCAEVPGGLLFCRGAGSGLGFWCGNSLKIGVDQRLARGTFKGPGNQIYREMLTPTGKREVISASKVVNSIVAFPGEDMTQSRVRALVDGTPQFVKPEQVQYILPSGDDMFSITSNLIPGINGIKGNRLLMGAKYLTQALALQNPEAPLVRAGVADNPERSYEQEYAKFVGALTAKKPGKVTAIDGNFIHVKYADGTKDKLELYNNFVFNQKSTMHNTPTVKPGDTFDAGQLLAKSNYTDDQGVTAVGTNLRIGWLPYKGNYEDGIVISSDAAKKLASEHMYSKKMDKDSNTTLGRKEFLATYPTIYTKDQLSTIDDDGIVKPGTVVQMGDPLVLAVGKNEPPPSLALLKHKRSWFSDNSMQWDSEFPGVVTDVSSNPSGIKIAVKSYQPAQVGDKLCFSPDHDLLTDAGWKNVKDITLNDKLYSIDPETNEISCISPVALHIYDHNERMYEAKAGSVGMCVTLQHKLFAATGPTSGYELIEAYKLKGIPYTVKHTGNWVGTVEDTVSILPSLDGAESMYAKKVPTGIYMLLLGLAIRNKPRFEVIGLKKDNVYFNVEEYVQQPTTHSLLVDLLTESGVSWKLRKNESGITELMISNKTWTRLFRAFCKNPHLPTEIFSYSSKYLKMLFDWALNTFDTSKSMVNTPFQFLVCDLHRLALSAGYVLIHVHSSEFSSLLSAQRIESTKINSGSVTDRYIQYSGKVYCPELSRNHTVYTRYKSGIGYWIGQSNRYGGKGIISSVLPPDQMPRDSENRPLEILYNPLTIISRVNPTALVEVALGKIARKTGKPYNLPAFGKESMVQFALNELRKHNIPETETVFDPGTNRHIPNVFTGEQFFMKLHHTVESKSQARDVGLYSLDRTPATGADGAAKRQGYLEMNALLAHGAGAILRDIKLLRGQKNDEFWRNFRMGLPGETPKESFIYGKFLNMLRAAGVNVRDRGNKLQVLAMTDRDVDSMAGDRELRSGDALDLRGMEPVPGGSFDLSLTGGSGGGRWSKINLGIRIPHPILENQIRQLMDLTGPAYEAKLKSPNGLEQIEQFLSRLDVDKEIENQKSIIKSGKASKRDTAVKKLRTLDMLKRTGLKPTDLLISKVPVLPPVYRPIAKMRGMELTSDANLLYKDLFEAKEALKDLAKEGVDTGEERLTVYNAVKAIVGLGDPVNVKHKEKNVGGMLLHIFGKSSPKFGMFQRKILSSTVDTVGRTVITPDNSLDMDQVGMPEAIAWDVYRPFIMRRLARRYNSGDAKVPLTMLAKWVADKDPRAKQAMLEEMKERPVLISRAPVLHKYGIMAAKPVLTAGHTLRTSPITTVLFNADYDGNCTSFDSRITVQVLKSAFDNTSDLWHNHTISENTGELLETCMRTVADSTLTLDDGSSVFTLPIGEFPRTGVPQKDKNGADVYPIPPGMSVLSYDSETNSVKYCEITNFTHEKNCACVEVQIGNRPVIVSNNASLAVFNHANGEMVKIEPAEAVGRFVPCLRKDPRPFGDFGNFDLGWLIGAFLSDGWVTGNVVGYAKAETQKRKMFERISREQITNNIEVREYSEHGDGSARKLGDSVKIHMRSIELAQRLSSWDLYAQGAETTRGALIKQIPDWMLARGSESFMWGLLSGLLDGDGSIVVNKSTNNKRFSARLATSSPYLRKGMENLCYRLGLRYSTTTTPPRGKTKECYVVNPSTIDLFDSLSNLRVIGEAEQSVLDQWKANPPNDSGANDLIPVADSERAILRRLCLDADKSAYVTLSKYPGQGRLSRIKLMELQSAGLLDSPELASLRSRANNYDVFWSKVEGFHEVEPRDVFDLCVTGTKVFFVNNGVLIYDSMNFHVPVSQEAVQEAYEKMLPSKNLFSSSDFTLTMKPRQEFLLGLWLATREAAKKEPRRFATKKDAMQALVSGKINLNDPVVIVGDGQQSAQGSTP